MYIDIYQCLSQDSRKGNILTI